MASCQSCDERPVAFCTKSDVPIDPGRAREGCPSCCLEATHCARHAAARQTDRPSSAEVRAESLMVRATGGNS